jgi:divalent metal cation (Fe/Co/Zn/Cd) transporter
VTGSSPASPGALGVLEPGSEPWQRQARLARWLAWASLGYMTAEGGIAVAAAIAAGSAALLGFGLDSVIEAAASIIVIWRLTGTRALSQAAERRARTAVAVTFFLLAPYITADAIRVLVTGEHPGTSWPGIGLAIASVIVMPLLGTAKKRIGARIGSAAVSGEGAENMVCAATAAAVLAGLAANSGLGWWWLDPAIALGIAVLAIREGREALEDSEEQAG